MNEKERILLTDDILTNLGFSEYWSGCGEFGTRYLRDPNDENKSIMGIIEMDAMKKGVYTGGYYHKEDTPAYFVTEDFFGSLNYMDELIVYSAQWPRATDLLIAAAEKHGYIVDVPNNRLPAGDGPEY